MSDATGPVQTGALCYFDWTCSECNRLVVAGEWHKHALIGHGVTDRALADVQILTEKVESLQSRLQDKTEECERLKERSTRIARRANAADSAMAQLKTHPNSKLDNVADYYYRLGYDAARKDAK